jgi:hypothetical protein
MYNLPPLYAWKEKTKKPNNTIIPAYKCKILAASAIVSDSAIHSDPLLSKAIIASKLLKDSARQEFKLGD